MTEKKYVENLQQIIGEMVSLKDILLAIENKMENVPNWIGIKQTADWTLKDILEVINTGNVDLINHYRKTISNNAEWQNYTKNKTGRLMGIVPDELFDDEELECLS